VVRDNPTHPLDDDPEVVVPQDAAGPDAPQIAWEYRGYRIGDDQRHWTKHGFAVVDLVDDALQVTYVDDEGHEYFSERLEDVAPA
jgi:hypothetical protein